MKNRPEEVFFRSLRLYWIYLADDGLHLLGVEDVGGVDHSGVGGPVHLCILLVLGLRRRKKAADERSDVATMRP